MPATAPAAVVRRQKMPSTSTGKKLEAASEKAAPTEEQDIARPQRGHVGSEQRHPSSSTLAVVTRRWWLA